MTRNDNIDKALRDAMERRSRNMPQLTDDFADQVMAKIQARKRRRNYTLWMWAGSVAAMLVIAFVLWPEQHETVVAEAVIAEAVPAEDPTAAEPETAPAEEPPVRATKKQAVQLASREEQRHDEESQQDVQVIPSTEARPQVCEYKTIRTVQISPDVVAYVIEASDIPDIATMPSVSELRARGMRLTQTVRQETQATVQF